MTREQEPTYSVGAVVRLTGLSAHVLRAWERRYGAVRPLRTDGGTRRYREADVIRLQRLRAAVAAGHPIGDIARLEDDELDRRAALAPAAPTAPLAAILEALDRLDAADAERLLGLQLSALGGARFARCVASPLLNEIGRRWEDGALCAASEHLASALLRTLLGSVLRPTNAAAQMSPILFTTPPGERHELGVLMAAVAAVDAGGRAIYLGPDLPVAEVAQAADALGAAAVALGVCQRDGAPVALALDALRRLMPASVELWVGGPGAAAVALPRGSALLADIDGIERKVALLSLRGAAA
ncbi:MAG TPA: MerR family transcriptional regulator [Myxococcota bacterium]|nr:MerR family transcriptional regulator [Myxococcota bacterium]